MLCKKLICLYEAGNDIKEKYHQRLEKFYFLGIPIYSKEIGMPHVLSEEGKKLSGWISVPDSSYCEKN